MSITAVSERVFDCLRRMDCEATTIVKGAPTGLNWYGGYAGNRQTEPQWSRRLVELLRADGLDAKRECRYPGLPRARCDVVIDLGAGETLWLEIKGAWKEYWRQQGNEWIYRSYLLHPLVAGLDKTKTHTAPLDLKKLETLTRRDAAYVGMLLVGFDSDTAPMDADVAELVRLAGLEMQPWTTVSTGWPDPHRPGCRVRCWLWHRAVTE